MCIRDRNGTVVRLAVDTTIEENDELFVSYLSLPGDQDWLTNQAGVGVLSFLDFPVSTSRYSSESLNPAGGGCAAGSSAGLLNLLIFVLFMICIVTLVRRKMIRKHRR